MSFKHIYHKILCFIFILFLIFNYYNVISTATDHPEYILINEVMFNPFEPDPYNEYVELYNPTNTSINISGWTITDNYAEDTLVGDVDHGNGTMIIPPYSYAIITDNVTTIDYHYNVSSTAIRLYVDDAAIGNGLSNSKDMLLLKNASGVLIDAMEYGDDYDEVPGSPADVSQENHSLCRYYLQDHNDSSLDFYEALSATPGSLNSEGVTAQIRLTEYPLTVPKVAEANDYSHPFFIHVSVTNFSENTSYKFKAFVSEGSDNPMNQMWWNNSWVYPNNYEDIITDCHGNWSSWIPLRFNKEYTRYQQYIEHNSTAYLKVKLKTNEYTYEESALVRLLDVDESTTNGTTGGYLVGIAEEDAPYKNVLLVLRNSTNHSTGITFTESNTIDEGVPSEPGFYKIYSPVGEKYTLELVDENNTIIQRRENLTISSGQYKVHLTSDQQHFEIGPHENIVIPFSVYNNGDFQDTLQVSIIDITPGWSASLDQERFTITGHNYSNTTVRVVPCYQGDCTHCSLELQVSSETDITQVDTISFSISRVGPDLTIPKIKQYSENEEITRCGQGELVRIKAYLKNQGSETAKNVDINFYYDSISPLTFLGSRHYDSIENYQKYPSVIFDTTHITPGNHTLIAIVDPDDTIDELDESNNKQITYLTIYPTATADTTLLTEVYYHTHSGISNEFITITNPTNTSVNLTEWYLTTQPFQRHDTQAKLLLPHKDLPPYQSLTLTQNASAYYWEIGAFPDYEYKDDSTPAIPQLLTTKAIVLSNNGGKIALKDGYNHTIDFLVYGDHNISTCDWNGTAVPSSGSGVILHRNHFDTLWVDTNTSSDWIQPRRYGIGQSQFPYQHLELDATITTFVSPDCSYDTIRRELENATDTILFNIYEFTNPFLCDMLVNALKRNVNVCIFVEGSPIGGIDDREAFILNRLHNHGAQIRSISQDTNQKIYARYTYDHGKYLIIDSKTVIVESCNWAKTGIPLDPSFGNREWGVVIRNKIVASYFTQVFQDDWNPQRCDSWNFTQMNLSIPPDFTLDTTIYSGDYEPSFPSLTIRSNCTVTPVFSPDTSYQAICDLIDSAQENILIEQLYIYKDWGNNISPFVERLITKAQQGVDINIILNFNPEYDATNIKCQETKTYLEQYNISVRFLYTNWSIFTNMHNKGMVVDNRSVLISSVNWNENSVTRNREAGVIIHQKEVAQYYANVFWYDWTLQPMQEENLRILGNDINETQTFYIVIVFSLTFAIIIRDWRNRKWT